MSAHVIRQLMFLVFVLVFVPRIQAQRGWLRSPQMSLMPAPFRLSVTSLDVASWPFAGDVTGDGVADVLIAGTVGPNLSWGIACALGLAGGGFSPPIYTIMNPSVDIYLKKMVHDLDGDGFGDLVGVAVSSGGAYALLSDGLGGFVASPKAPNSFMGIPGYFDFADVDGDGAPELVGPAGGFSSGVPFPIQTWKWQQGGWTPWAQTSTAYNLTELHVGDFNADGNADIFVCHAPTSNSTAFYVLLGDGTGSGYVETGPHHPGLDTGYGFFDVDGDGAMDVATSESFNAAGWPEARIFRGDPSAILLPPIVLPYLLTPVGVLFGPGLPTNTRPRPQFADVNDDGVADWIWTGSAADSTNTVPGLHVRVLLGNGGGNFSMPYIEDEALPAFGSAGLSDIDGDGDPDLVVSATNNNTQVSYWGAMINESRLGPGTAGAVGVPPVLSFSTPSRPGNAGFLVELTQAWPLDQAVLALSLGSLPVGSGPASWWLNPNLLVLPSFSVGVTTTNATGDASFLAPIPPGTFPGVLGLEAYLQWLVRDPAGPYGVGGSNFFAFSNARKIVVW